MGRGKATTGVEEGRAIGRRPSGAG